MRLGAAEDRSTFIFAALTLDPNEGLVKRQEHCSHHHHHLRFSYESIKNVFVPEFSCIQFDHSCRLAKHQYMITSVFRTHVHNDNTKICVAKNDTTWGI